MKTLCAVSFAILLGISQAHAFDTGTTSADFLKLGIGPRAVAMGEAQVGVADDVYATYWNPAGLSQLKTQEAGLVHTQYLENITSEYLTYAYPSEHAGTFAGSLTYLNVGKFQGYDAVGQPADQVGANDAALAFSYSRPLYRDRRLGTLFSAGVTGKAIQEHLDTVSAKAFAIDAGLFFEPGLAWGDWLSGVKAGLSLKNLGTSLTFDQDSFTLPRSATAGLSWSGSLLGENVTLAGDAQQPNDGKQTISLGAEILTLQALVLRGGYTSSGDIGNGLRAGAGLKLKTFEFDYAFASGGDFGAIHRIGLTLQFGNPPEDPEKKSELLYLRGVKDYSKNRLTDALVDFNKALEVDPSNPQALDMMHKTYDRLKAITPDQ